MPTFVSCGVDDTNNSLVIRTPVSGHNGRKLHRTEGKQLAGRRKDAITVLREEGSKPGRPGRAGCRNSEFFSTDRTLFRGCDRSLKLPRRALARFAVPFSSFSS